MLFEKEPLFATELKRESGENVLYVNFIGANFIPSLSSSPQVMARTIDLLSENSNISRIVFVQQRNYSFSLKQVNMLIEVATLFNFLIKTERVLSEEKINLFKNPSAAYNFLSNLLNNVLKQDPIMAYRFLKDELNRVKEQDFYRGFLETLLSYFNQLALIKVAIPLLERSDVKGREVYSDIFRPDIIPNFTFTRAVLKIPANCEIIEEYEIGSDSDKAVVSILKEVDSAKLIYHISSPEYSLEEDYHVLLSAAREILSEHRPTDEEFNDLERTRQVFFNVARDLIQDLSKNRNIRVKYSDVDLLATILVRHTIGFGILEVLLQDENIQDLMINAPSSKSPIFVKHGEFGECISNIIVSQEDVDSWASKFRMLSGRPLDEAHPVLDTSLNLNKMNARVAIVQQPLSPEGVAYTLRRHRDKPWTLPLFIKNKMLDGLSAGLLSFLVDGARTMIIAGTRSSGKCVAGDTLIQLSDGRMKKIKDLVGEDKQKIEDGMIHHPISNSCCKSLVDLKMGNRIVTDVWKRSSPNKLIRIKTKTGKEIITTKEHPYFLYSRGIKNKRADELEKKDLIATPRILSFENNQKRFIDLRKEPFLLKEEKEFYIFKGRTNASCFKFPKFFNRELAEFLGYLIGDGHLDEKKIEFHNLDEGLRERYKKLIELFGIHYKEFKSHSTYVIQISCRLLCMLLNKTFGIPFGRKADKVIIPEIVLISEDSILASFLRAYFDCDSYVSKKIRTIEISTASKDMIEHLRLALLRFGIVSCTKRKEIKGKFYYSGFIYGSFVENFSKFVGFNHFSKRQKLQDLLSKDRMNNTNIDVIPEGDEILRELRTKFRVSPSQFRLSGKDYWSYENNQYRVSRHWFDKIIKFYEERMNFLSGFEKKVNKLKEFEDFGIENYFNSLYSLKRLLRLSYSTMAEDVGISGSGVRKILLNQKTESLQILNGFINNGLFEKRLSEIEQVLSYSPNLVNLPMFVESGLISYAEISRETKIPETTIKSFYSSGSVAVDKKELIEKILVNLKERVLFDLKNAKEIFNEINRNVFDFMSMGMVLGELRAVLNIKNEEFSEDLSVTSISNFFNGVCVPNAETVKQIIRKVVEIYENAMSGENFEFFNMAKNLSCSEIFWDEVLDVREIDKVEDFVYDLSVEGTHNFVANGLIAHNTSLLGSLMLEIMPRYRILSIEDTLELPINELRKLDYDVLSMKVRSALTGESNEVSAEEGIRASLRLGDSSLIVGEIRSDEAKALYEAMRVGALANVVAGTIHGASPYAVFDRVVNDLNVPVTSFKATDCIVVVNPIKSADGMKSWRRLLGITEVRKHWTKDPLEEGGFVDLMKYDVEKDKILATSDLINGDSEMIKSIAANVRGWAGNWDAVWDNIMLRQKVKEEIVKISDNIGNPEIMESGFCAKANNSFHEISEKIREEVGLPVSERVFSDWQKWLNNEAKKFGI
jgi:type IV secretory pathway ATPase VirB11/archaellum biosynthesis ATPase